MRILITMMVLVATTLVSWPAQSQHQTTPAATAASATPTHEFDFLVGDWTLTVHPRINALAAMIHGAPELLGTWHAERAFAGQGLEDELRITDASGNPAGWVRTLRIYDQSSRKWKQASVDVQRVVTNLGNAEWRNQEMWQISERRNLDGTVHQIRLRFHDIQKDQFSVQQDRSEDGGKTWDEAVLTMTATRAGAGN
ncbi:hypothetical protein C7S18_03990 [Ahniella affigens]|uniref:DUF1579 domain-containing protein n=1 Tax=Ahniella affigens TaxID=2021234 RepID=A0A2P1PNH8_9GAMM|nr:hypothetical protein [Ahniella affigens]AVP96404.1 hypothetical protein C7S18_03990 [Ahniella affigens]